jgi:hypothetical protein
MKANIPYKFHDMSKVDENAADNINPRVIGLRTLSKFSILALSLNLLNNFDTIVSPITEKTITPIEADMEPNMPETLKPTNVAQLIAIGPGVDCDSANRSKNSWFDKNPYLAINSC